MKRLLRLALATAALAGALTVHAAGAYNPAIVAADARWVLHADLNGLRSSQLGRELVTAIEKAQTQATDGVIGLNIPKLFATVGTVTAYGTNLVPEPEKIDGALIAQGTPELRKIAESILLQGTLAEPKVFSEVTDLPFPAYAISDPQAAEGKQTQVVIAFPPEPIVLVSKSKAQITKARDVFRGSAPSLAKTSGSALGKMTPNSTDAFFFAASVVPAEPLFPEKAPQARILQLASAGSIGFGERGADTFAHAELHASSDRNAEKLAKILEGLTSMLSLAESNDKQLADFLNASKVSRDNDVVTLKLSYPTARLVQMSQILQQQAAAQPTPRQPQISMGKVVAEWKASEASPSDGTGADALSWHTVENVKLVNGATVTVGRTLNGGKNARFDRVEVVPAGGGAPMSFGPGMMRHRGAMQQLQFPGADGVYTVKIAFINDPEGKAKFALSVLEPKETPATPAPRSPAAR